MIKKHIPNFITTLNVLCGSIAVVFILKGALTTAVLLILFAAIFDFLDGMSARVLKAYSPVGKELDSLADVISFGLAPGLIMYKLLNTSMFNENVIPDLQSNLTLIQLLTVGSAFLIPVFRHCALQNSTWMNVRQPLSLDYRLRPMPCLSAPWL